MGIMNQISLTYKSIMKPGLLGLMLACAVLALIVVLGAVVFVTWGAGHFVHFETAWVDSLFTWVIGIVLGIGGWFMLPVLTVLVGGIFQENVIYRVEKACYPESERSHTPRFWPDFWHDLKFTSCALLLNVFVLPLYFFGIGFVISILLNSYLLGREFFEGAAGYHLGKPEARELSKDNPRKVYGGGLAITLMTLIPILNMFVPIIGTVWMVHVYHDMKMVVPSSSEGLERNSV